MADDAQRREPSELDRVGDQPTRGRAETPQLSVATRKTRTGVVTSDAREKTITVRIDVSRPHPVYGKTVRRSSKLHVHDERNEAGVGDVVRVVECRPLSSQKRWRLVEVIERAK